MFPFALNLKLTRRNLLIAGAGGALIALGGGLYFRNASLASAIRRTARNRLKGVNVDAADLDRYIADFARYRAHYLLRRDVTAALRLQGWTLNMLLRPAMPKGVRIQLEDFEGQLLGPLLLGSNFFNEATPPAKLEYYGFPDPASLKCANPLARFD